MFEIQRTADSTTVLLVIELPQGKTAMEILQMAQEEFNSSSNSFTVSRLYGKHVKVTGRITTGLAIWLGHSLAHICKSVSLFDPKENRFDVIISH